MDQASNPESRERAVSSEPCSTRPNPFDDSESSRQRRRTSMNGGASRSRSVDTVKSSQDLPAVDSEPAQEDSAMKLHTDPTTPQTPDRQPGQSNPPSSGPVSSRVTINLRSAGPRLDTIPSSPLSPQSPTPASQPVQDDDVKISVEESEVDMPSADPSAGTPAPSASDTGSPPVEVIDVQPEDADFEAGQPEVTLLQDV